MDGLVFLHFDWGLRLHVLFSFQPVPLVVPHIFNLLLGTDRDLRVQDVILSDPELFRYLGRHVAALQVYNLVQVVTAELSQELIHFEGRIVQQLL